jgi:hypothetical protein
VKASAGTLAAILVLSLAVWTFFYLSPGAPLDGAETTVVVGVCAGVVLLARWVWARLRGSRRGDADASR